MSQCKPCIFAALQDRVSICRFLGHLSTAEAGLSNWPTISRPTLYDLTPLQLIRCFAHDILSATFRSIASHTLSRSAHRETISTTAGYQELVAYLTRILTVGQLRLEAKKFNRRCLFFIEGLSNDLNMPRLYLSVGNTIDTN